MRDCHQLVSLSACQLKGKDSKPSVFSVSLWIKFTFLLVFAGCVPATVPPQLNATQGPPIVITDEEYDAGAFQVRYPAGWRVITSATTSPTTVIFAASDNAAIMLFGVDADEAPMPEAEGQIRTEKREISLKNDVTVTAILNAPADHWESFAPIFEESVESVK